MKQPIAPASGPTPRGPRSKPRRLLAMAAPGRDASRILIASSGGDPTGGALAAASGLPARVPWIEVAGQEPPTRSAAGLVAYLERRGIELTLARGRLLVRSRSPLNVRDRALIQAGEELILGHLRGIPAICALCAEPAVGVGFPKASLCQEHAGQ